MSRRARVTISLVAAALVALVALVVVAGTAAAGLTAPRFRLDGQSMAPCYPDGATVTLERGPFAGRRALKRGDLIVFQPPIPSNRAYLKRVVALGGETVAARDGRTFVNGAPLDEPYVNGRALYTYPPVRDGQPEALTVPDGAIFVLGDNRNNSSDSHIFGPVPVGSVVGRAITPCQGAPTP